MLDTNICIYYFKGLYGLKEKISKIGYKNFSISEITITELIYGAEKSQNISKNIRIVDNFIEKIDIVPIFSAIRIYGKEKARL
ncbi:MAG: PIN domain-containing protein, partial [Cyclobacteriaceae bacterium]|nr:PIN domain-containing protein [Cyclobacteriaceae bacterium]